MGDAVTAAAFGEGAGNGILLRVLVLDNTAHVQDGATASQSGGAAHQASITTTTVGSVVVGAVVNGDNVTMTPDSGTVFLDNAVDNTNTRCYGTILQPATVTPGTATRGTGASFEGGIALLEVLPAAGKSITITELPPVTVTASGTAATASFTPPGGTLLVALVAAGGQTLGFAADMVLSDLFGLRWYAAEQANAASQLYAGVWYARVQDFPAGVLDAGVDLNLGGTWTDVTSLAYQREGSSPAVTITRGRPDERSTATAGSAAWQFNNRDGRFSPRNPVGPYYGELGRNTAVRWSVPDRGASLRIEDDTTSSASATAPAITGDIDIRLEMWLSGYTPAVLISAWPNWAVTLEGDGTLSMWIEQSGPVITRAQSTMPITVGHQAIRVTRAHSTGTVTFYTAPTIASRWVQLGQTSATATGNLGSASADLAVGFANSVASPDASYDGPSGRFYSAQLYSGIGLAGTLEASPVFGPSTGSIIAVAYEYPTNGAEEPFWVALAAAPGVQYAIVNPDSGPGSSADPNYVAVIALLQESGVTVLGYVDTGRTTVPTGTVETNVGLWQSLYGITDIFFDDVTGASGDITYYTTVCNYVHAQVTGSIVVINPGDVPASSYAAIADITVVFENSESNWDLFTPASWMAGYPPSAFAAIVYSTSGQALMQTVAAQALAYGVGHFYITDQSVYTLLPTYLDTEGTVLLAGAGGPAPGPSGFTDAQANTWAVTGTATINDRSYRGHFECSALPQRWDVTGTDVWTPVAGAGVLRRLAQGSKPELSAMRRAILEETNGAYWPCEDATGSTSIASGLPGGTPMTVSGAPVFQNQPGTSSSDSIFTCSAALPQVQSSTWTGLVPAYTDTGIDGVTFLLNVPSSSGPVNSFLALAQFAAGGYLALAYSTAAGGTLSLDISGATTVTGPTGINDTPLLVQMTNAPGSTVATLTWLPLGLAETENSVTGTSAITGQITSVTVNHLSAALGNTEIGQIWVTGFPPDLQQVLQDPFNAWLGETAGNRFYRLCGENDISGRVYGPPDTTAAMGAQAVDTLLNLLQECETADRGIIYEPSQVLGLGYRTLASLCNQAAAITLDYSQAELGGGTGLEPVDDDQYTLNDITATIGNNAVTGTSYEAVLDDGSPMSVSPPDEGGAGEYDTTVTINAQTVTGMQQAASWMLHIGTVNEERYPTIPLNLARSELALLLYDVQDVLLGDFTEIVNLPSFLPPGAVSQLAYGVTESFGGFWYLLAWNAVPESPYEVAVAGTGSGDSAHADTDGSTLHSSATSTATTLSVSTTNSGSPLWTTTAADFPFDILVSGEQVTVTNITGGSSPQTFTVVRSVNGVVKAQSAGAAVALYHTPIAALT